ncbi:MAG: DUF4398 domain-containing protein [Lysobacterales bacterium]
MKPILIALLCLILAACTTVRPDAAIFESAENALQVAEAAGGDEFAPVEMRFAREKLASAKKGLEKEKYQVSVYLVEESEINAELAIEKSRTAKLRRRVTELRKSNEELEARLHATYGEEFK